VAGAKGFLDVFGRKACKQNISIPGGVKKGARGGRGQEGHHLDFGMCFGRGGRVTSGEKKKKKEDANSRR